MKRSKGITLVALIITIIILLILAVVTINSITGDGIIAKAQEAKKNTEVASEIEIIRLAKMFIEGEFNVENFQKQLDELAGEGKTVVTDAVDILEVYFKETNRYYPVEKSGNIGEYGIIESISNAGDITKGGTLNGSKEKPYEINCVEDLVVFSNISNATGMKFQNEEIVEVVANDYNNVKSKYIVLKRDLNFKSKYSYENNERIDFGDVNRDGKVETLQVELTTGVGFIPINTFTGTFNGNGYTIGNIYINKTGDAGLFIKTEGATIKNLSISGIITSIDGYAGGIVAYQRANGVIEKCSNRAIIQGRVSGGIVGASSGSITISNCYNLNSVNATEEAGGILGYAKWANSITKITKSYNIGNITSTGENCYASGIIGRGTGASGGEAIYISYCYNKGIVKNDNGYASGIIGFMPADKITSCYNAGSIISDKEENRAGVYQRRDTSAENITNCFYMQGTSGVTREGTTEKTESEMKMDTFVNELNNNLENAVWRIDKNKNDGFPIF